MSLIFEVMNEADIPFIKGIIDGFTQFNPKQISTFLSNKQNIALVAKLDNKIIGFIYGYSLTSLDGIAPKFFIYSVDVHPDYQNKGYGSRFIKYVIDWAKNNGFCESFVLTEKDNTRACRVYEKAGMTYSENDCDRLYVIEYMKD